MRIRQRFRVFPSSRTTLAALLLLALASASLGLHSSVNAEEETTEAEPAIDRASSEDDAESSEQPPSGSSNGTWNLLGRALGALFGVDSRPSEDDAMLALVGSEAPDFKLESTDGGTTRLTDLRGRVVVLDFWATWCGPCMLAMPELQKVHEEFSEQPVTVLGVNQADELQTILETLEEKKLSFSHVLDDGSVAEQYHVSGIPQTVLIDAQGVVQAVHIGYSPALQATLSRQINELLNGERLYDPAQVAAARARRQQRQAEVVAQIGLHHPERLERLDEVLADEAAMIENDYRPAQWVQLPGEEGRALVFFSSENRLAIVRPAPARTETVDLQWDDEISVWDYCPTFTTDQALWMVVGAEYNEAYEFQQLRLALFSGEGTPLWTKDYPRLAEDSDPDVDVTAGDLIGDEDPEIAMLVAHDGIEAAGLTGPEGSTRVLSVYDLTGELLVRAWVPGYGGTGVHVLPGADGNTLLIATSEGLTRFRIGRGE